MMLREEANALRRFNLVSPTAFQSQTQQYYIILQSEEKLLLHTYTSFINVCQIWPDQCKQIILYLQKLSKPLEQFKKLLESFYPAPLNTSHRLILMLLQNIVQQIKDLIQLFHQLMTMYQMPLKRSHQRQKRTQQAFELFTRTYSEILENTPLFLDQIRFQQSK
jgi:hypothetical protein